QQTAMVTTAAGTNGAAAQSQLASCNSSKSRQSQQQYPLNEAAAQTHTTVNTNRHKSAANRNGHKRSYRSKATHNMASRNSSSPPPQQAEYALSKACFNQATL
ncbi:MAG: hypothetical protein K2N86_05025, partial [Rikenellaceae bacterium]|nr:hypothetical protein [Rikenellaceae bacterium]